MTFADIKSSLNAETAAGVPKRNVRFTTADTIQPEPVDWVWDRRVPSGAFGLLAGREGLGKSTAMLDIVAQLTRGTLDGIYKGEPRSVIIAATEDSWSHVIIPRLMAAGADMTKVMKVHAEVGAGEDELTLPVDLQSLEEAIKSRGDVCLMLLDPLLPRLSAKLDTHKDAEVRRALEPLVKLADAVDIVVVGIIHVNKSDTSDPLNAVMGSRAFSAVSRFVLFVVEDPNDPSTRLFGQPKNNLGPTNQNTLTFTVEERRLTAPDGRPITTSRIVWGGGDPRTIREILHEAKSLKAPTKEGEAMRWLKHYLDQRKGISESNPLKADALTAGFNAKMVERAAHKLQVAFQRLGHPSKGWYVAKGAQLPLTPTK